MSKRSRLSGCDKMYQSKCPKWWSELKESDDPKVRFCDTCQEHVYRCDDHDEIGLHRSQGHCVAFHFYVRPLSISDSVKSCVALGRATENQETELDQLIADSAVWMHQYFESQDPLVRLINNFSILDAGALIRGLVVLEKELSWDGGSVGGVIRAYRALEMKKPDIGWLDDLTQWILENTNNPWNPFGTSVRHGAKNRTDFGRLSGQHEQRALRNTSKQKDLKVISDQQKEQYEEFKENSVQLRLSSGRVSLIGAFDGEAIDEVVDALERISESNYTANTFSTRIAESTDSLVLARLNYQTKKALALRLIGRKRGPWGQFKKKLYRSLNDQFGCSWSRLLPDYITSDLYEFYVDECSAQGPACEADNGTLLNREEYFSRGIGEVDHVWYRIQPTKHDPVPRFYALDAKHPSWPNVQSILAEADIHNWDQKFFSSLDHVCDETTWTSGIQSQSLSYIMGGRNAAPDGFIKITDFLVAVDPQEWFQKHKVSPLWGT